MNNMVIWFKIIKQNIIKQMQIPQQAYRWLVSIQIIGNEGEIGEKGMVAIPTPLVVHFESGFNIAEIVKSILKRSGNNIPASLENVRKDASKNVKLTNWNFVWLSFDDLRMQFDTRIKDLILQGENALIVEIIKQLCDRDDHKNQKSMKAVVIKDKSSSQKVQKTIRNPSKSNALDIKKINLQKSPDESQSSLQFLILLLSSSLNMTVQQILGLFTNQNKYLAHIIVKGINDDFSGIILFYTLLNKHSQKLKAFIQNDKKDADSCLYAIKPGFISKSQQVTILTIEVFGKIGNIYEWLVSQSSRGSTTLLLGIKRHPTLGDDFWQLLNNLIINEQVDFFATHFKQSFKDSRQMIEICMALAKPIGESYLKNKLLEIGILAEWLQIAVNMFEGPIEDQILTLTFLGEFMLHIPESITENEQCLQVFSRGWKDKKKVQFVMLIDQILTILDKLAFNRSQYASKVYQIIIEIFEQIYEDKVKKQYLVQNFVLLIASYPKMPSHYFIQAYSQNYLDPADYHLIHTSASLSEDIEGLAKIGQVILRIFNSHAVLNGYLAPLIYNIAKKIINNEIGHAFVLKAVKDTLHAFSIIETQKKNPQVAKPQPMYFNYKGNSEKLSEQEVDVYRTKQKQTINLTQLVDKLCQLSKNLDLQSLNSQLRDQLLDSNAYIRKNNFKVGSKAMAGLLKKLNITKQDQQNYDEQYRNKKSIVIMEQSMARKKSVMNNLSVLAASRIGGPEHLKKQFSDIVEKRKKQEEQRKAEEEKKQKQQIVKQAQIKKQLQRQQLLRGFGSGQAQLKQEGFWNKIIKEQNKQLQLYPPVLMEQRDIDFIQNLFKKYHRIARYLFVKYSASMYSTKSVNNFEDNQTRKETLNLVQAIKFLKDYKLLFLTNQYELMNLIRDINVKLLNKRENQELDFVGFEHFLIQFSAIIFTKPHTINAKNSKGSQNIKKHLVHLSHAQLLEQIFNYIKLVFIEKGQNTSMFDEPEAAYFNQSEVIKQFNRKIEEDPNFILPEGYKKVTDKVMAFVPVISPNIKKGFNSSYIQVMEVLDEIIFQSKLKLHILEPTTQKSTKTRVKPQVFGNVKAKLMTDTIAQGKTRAMSSAVDRKVPLMPPVKMLQRKVLSFGMKLGLSYIGYKDKLLGEQVAYLLDDMVTAIENGKTTIQKSKKMNDVIRSRNLQEQNQRKNEIQKQKKRKERKEQLEKIKKQTAQKKQKQLQQTKQQRQKKKQKELQKEKKKKEDTQKYLAQQKAKLKEKKQKQQEQKAKQQQQKKKKKQQQKKNKQKFKDFNEKKIQKLKKEFQETVEQRKKKFVQTEEQKNQKDQLYKKLRSKISSQDRKIIEIRQKNNEEISELFSSEEIAEVFKKFQPNLKALFDFLIKGTHLSLTERKHNNQVIEQTWHYFNMAFQLNPYIINAKSVLSIFKSLTKDKQISKEYYLGLNFEEFQQALLRIAIKHKTIFNKLAQKIKENDMSQKQIDAVIDKDIQQKEKNEFDQPKEIDVKGLLVEEDINKQVYDDYGEIKKVTPTTLKGLIYYLKVPRDKPGQQKRFREVLGTKNTYMQKYQKLKQKLKEQYSLQTQTKKKASQAPKTNNQSQIAKTEQNVEKSAEKEIVSPPQKPKAKK